MILSSVKSHNFNILTYDILAGDETIIKRTFQMVADWRGSGTNFARASGAVAAGGREPGRRGRIAAAEACSELNLTSCDEAVRTSLQRYHDEAGAEVAFALGVVGTLEDLPDHPE